MGSTTTSVSYSSPTYTPSVSVNIPSYGGGGRSTVPIHRFWHAGINDHFYTTNSGEGFPHGYQSEGVGFNLSSVQTPGLVPVYRYYKNDTKDHFYTSNSTEIGVVSPGMSGNHGYVCEGILGYISPSPMPGTIPVYRYWKASTHDHFYTTNSGEIGAITSGVTGNHGYMCEGVLGYAFM
jgi:hypothetical protein